MTLPQSEKSETEETDDLKIKGAMLVKVRGMTPDERAAEGWQAYPEDIPCTEYDNGAVLYPACETCDKPGTIYASYAGGRWGLGPTGEPYERPASQKKPKSLYSAVALAVLLVALTGVAVATLWKVNQDQREQVQQQQQIIRQQRAMMDRQMESQRTIQRIILGNRADVEKALDDIRAKVDGVVAERDGLRDANAQLGQSNERLSQRNEQLKKGGGGRGGR
jgi:hypothetical protein